MSSPPGPDSKTVFLVQLSAILSQVLNVLQAGVAAAPSNTNLLALKTTVAEWMSSVKSASVSEELEGLEGAPKLPETEVLTPTSDTGTDIPLPLSTPVVLALPVANDIGTHTLVELVQLVAKLFTVEGPESGKLRTFARNLIHLVQVRCVSTLRESLHYVVLLTYGKVEKVPRSRSLSTDAGIEAETMGGDVSNESTARTASAVHLAHVIRTSGAALTECLELTIFQSDRNNLRFPLQISVDTLKHLYKMMKTFTRAIERTEMASINEESRVKMQTDRVTFDKMVELRIVELRAIWGCALTHSLSRIGRSIPPIISFLVSIAAQSPEMNSTTTQAPSPPPQAQGVGVDAAHALFAFAPHGEIVKKTPNSSSDRAEVSPANDTAAGIEKHGFGSFAAVLLARLGLNYATEFVAALSAQCGDDNEGSLVATRIVTDSLRLLAAESSAILECLVSQRWRYHFFDGILARIVSMQPAVLASGLGDLQLVATTCIGSSSTSTVGSEIGTIYSGCIFRLLESGNCPLYAKRQFMLHLLQTFLQYSPPSRSPHGGGSPIPLLLHLYHTFDLDLHAHSLNIVQQFIAVLSRIVRMTPASEFRKDTESQQQLLRRLRKSKDSDSGDLSVTDGEALIVYQQSLPLMALHGLVVAMELLRVQVPPETLVDSAVTRLLPPCNERDIKQKEQHMVDIFNESPKKAIQMLVEITPEIVNPPGSEAFLEGCEATKLPAPANKRIADKVQAVADFIWSIPALHAEAVSDYITTPAVFPLQVCANLMKRLPLSGLDLVDALNEFFFAFTLSKEGQRVERLLEYFSDAYFDANQGRDVDPSVFPFVDKEACFVTTVGTVMLNTNLHNPRASTSMTEDTFYAQMKACNGDKGFSPSFIRNIFTRIARSPFSSAVSPALAQTAAENLATSRGLDSLFISTEERKQIAFGLERQRVLMEVHYVLHSRKVASPPNPQPDSLWWPRITRDLFLSTWSSVCAVFGPAMFDGAEAPEVVLPKCVRGLQALLCVAASFALSTECEAMLLSILGLCTFDSVRTSCRTAVLVVSGSPYSVFFSERCWVLVLGLICTLKKENHPLPTHVENVMARLEAFTRYKERGKDETDAESEAAAQQHSSSSLSSNEVPREGEPESTKKIDPDDLFSAAGAANRALKALMSILKDVPVNDTDSLASVLELLERCLEYTRITHGSTDHLTEVANYLNVEGFSSVVLPHLHDEFHRHAESDAALQLIGTYVTRFFATLLESNAVESSAHCVTCFDFFRTLFDSAVENSLVQAHVLQCVGQLASSSLLAPHSKDSTSALYTSFSVWRRVLYPVVMSFTSPQCARNEISGLASMVLRKVVQSLSGCIANHPSGEDPTIWFPPVLLLANTCYIGAMCSEADIAHSGVSLLASLCLSGLSLHAMPRCEGELDAGSVAVTPDTSAPSEMPQEQLLKAFVSPLQDPDSCFLVTHLLERLSLLLRSEREPIRAEAVEHLRKLLPAMNLPRRHSLHRHLVVLLTHVVLGGTVMNRAPMSLVDPTLISFWLFSVAEVPHSMRRCSRSSFRSTVHPVLRLMTTGVLSVCPPTERAEVAELMMVRCLTVLVLSPSASPATRALGAFFFSPCVEVCGVRGCDHAKVREVLGRCVGIILFWLTGSNGRGAQEGERDPESPSKALHSNPCGFTWVEAHAKLSHSERQHYNASAEEALDVLHSQRDNRWITGGGTEATMSDFMKLCNSLDDPSKSLNSFQQGRSRSVVTPELSAAEKQTDTFSLLTNLLSGLPNALSQLEQASLDDTTQHTSETNAIHTSNSEGGSVADSEGWCLPSVTPIVLIQLLVEMMTLLFTSFWSVNHPAQLSERTTGNVIMPHTAVRGVLNTYLELALKSEGYPLHLLKGILEDLTGLMSTLQMAVSSGQRTHSTDSFAASSISSKNSVLVDVSLLQQLNPQEQQHIRNCNSGMYHELCAVLEFWIRRLTPLSDVSERHAEISRLSMDYHVCSSLVQLLPEDGGPLVASLKGYLIWFMRQRTGEGPQ